MAIRAVMTSGVRVIGALPLGFSAVSRQVSTQAGPIVKSEALKQAILYYKDVSTADLVIQYGLSRALQTPVASASAGVVSNALDTLESNTLPKVLSAALGKLCRVPLGVMKPFLVGGTLPEVQVTVRDYKSKGITVMLDRAEEAGTSPESQHIAFNEVKASILAEGVELVALKLSSYCRISTLEKMQSGVALSPVEATEVSTARAYISDLAETASETGKTLMFDAEQSYIEKVIKEAFVVPLAKEINKREKRSVVGFTFQALIKGEEEAMKKMIEAFESEEIDYYIKWVRGAYKDQEDSVSRAANRESPAYDVIEDTHATYNSAIPFLLDSERGAGKVIFATHNSYSLTLVRNAIREDAQPSRFKGRVEAGFLQGMAPIASMVLGDTKEAQVVVYGPYEDLLVAALYLLRRVSECNSAQGIAKINQEVLLGVLKARGQSVFSSLTSGKID